MVVIVCLGSIVVTIQAKVGLPYLCLPFLIFIRVTPIAAGRPGVGTQVGLRSLPNESTGPFFKRYVFLDTA